MPVTEREGPYGCETSRLPHFVHSRLTDGGEVVGLTHWPPFTPREDSWYSFLLETESTPGPQCDWNVVRHFSTPSNKLQKAVNSIDMKGETEEYIDSFKAQMLCL
jgi:hypothetical protein